MKTLYKSLKGLVLLGAVMASSMVMGQSMQYFRPNSKAGVNVFETPKKDTVGFEGLKIKVGAALALQFQGLNHENATGSSGETSNLVELGKNFNLPTANLDLDAQLYNGVRLHMRTFLSSRHHNETYVKGWLFAN